MLIDTARRGRAAAEEMLALVNEGSASCAEMREMLKESKATVAVILAAQTSAAAAIAGRERHGDGGTEVLAVAAGMSRRDARSRIDTAKVIDTAPAVRDAVESGRVSQANARRLAEAVEKTSAADVESDRELLAKAESMRPEQFAREARRWTADHQHDRGAADYRRLRARRCVRIWDGDDGMVHLRGEFDPVTGRRVANRLRAEARKLYHADKQHAADRPDRRSFDQCMADAVDNLTNIAAATGNGGGKPLADICVVVHADDATGELIAELPDRVRLPPEVLEQLSCNAKLTGVVYDRKGKPIWPHLAHPIPPHRHRSPMAAPHRQMGRLLPLRSEPRHLPRPPHRTRLTRRPHQTRQPGAGLLDLPPPHPPQRLADPQTTRRQPHPAPTRHDDNRTRPHPRTPATTTAAQHPTRPRPATAQRRHLRSRRPRAAAQHPTRPRPATAQRRHLRSRRPRAAAQHPTRPRPATAQRRHLRSRRPRAAAQHPTRPRPATSPRSRAGSCSVVRDILMPVGCGSWKFGVVSTQRIGGAR